jgi:hypothetical protein
MLTARNVNKYFPESEESQKGHMRQKRSGVQKTNRRSEFKMLGNDKEVHEIEIGLTYHIVRCIRTSKCQKIP